ncbi:phage tail protein [Sorangium sp. So ce296]|uniref:phage tail protein n=1 Tax=Sorangium sp. So ce296 TaxID=3133296 RepID=UPI003F620555
MITPIPDLLPQRELVVDFRFGVFFLVGGVAPNPLDIRFKRVKGLSATVKTTPLAEGGQNLYTQRLPDGVEYGNLVLERGLIVGSPLHLEVEAALSLFKFAPSNVVVTLFNDAYVPVSAWFFFKAYPVRWAISDLDAASKGVLVDTLELAYARMQIMRV